MGNSTYSPISPAFDAHHILTKTAAGSKYATPTFFNLCPLALHLQTSETYFWASPYATFVLTPTLCHSNSLMYTTNSCPYFQLNQLSGKVILSA
jgi:hypothetical protein